MVLAGLVAAAVAGIGVVARSAPGDSPGADPLVAAPGTEPRSYTITYRTTVGDDVSTEVVSVRRPYESRIEIRSGPPPGGERRSLRVSRFGAIETSSDEAYATHLTVAPSLAGGDLRMASALTTAAERGRVLMGGRSTIAGRRCTRYVTGGPVTSGSLLPYVTGGAERADVCVDRNGLLLEERWFKGDSTLRSRRATRVSAFEGRSSDFVIRGAIPLAGGADGVLTAVTGDSRLPLGSWEIDGPIKGFARQGRWTSISPRLGAANNPFDQDAGRQAALVEIWVRGIDVVFIEQGSLLGSGGPLPTHPQGVAADLGALGAGEVVEDLRLNEARANIAGFGYIRVAGTLPLDDIIAIARRLVARPGGSLTPATPTKTKDSR